MTYLEIATEIGKLVEEKNKAYGKSYEQSGEILRILYPNGIKPEQYQDALGIVRVIDKLFRIATAKDAFGESPWRDIAGYGILGAAPKESSKRLISEDSFPGVSDPTARVPCMAHRAGFEFCYICGVVEDDMPAKDSQGRTLFNGEAK